MRFPAWWLLFLGAATVTFPSFADQADVPSQEAAVDAVARARDAKRDFDAGRFEQALKGFSEADARAHSPVFVLYKARSQRELGRWLRARETLRGLSAESVDEEAPAQWRSAVEQAHGELKRLEARIPQVTVRLEGARGHELVRIDDRPYRNRPLDLDPGAHEVVVSRDGQLVARVPFELVEGEQRALVVDVSPPPAPAPKPVPSAAPVPDLSRQSRGEGHESTSLRPGGYALLGLGGAWLVVGAVTGGLALERAARAREACGPTGRCENSSSERDASVRLANASTGSLVLGGVSVLAGVTLMTLPLLWSSPDEELGLTVGPGSLTLRRRF